ncbi:MAG: LysM peptidoglycan-binding domain-containing protein [Christensenellales bacterium]
MIVYKVKKDDTLIGIARNFKTTVAKIKELNKIENVRFGERLIIEEGDGKHEYTVGPFETLTTIAKKFGTTEAALKSLNGNEVKIGEIINIPL